MPSGAGRVGRVLRMGLTGGIASGKTVVSDRLARRGAVVVDADVLAREVVEPGTPGLAAVVEWFGRGVLLEGDSAGSAALDRAALGRTVFADPVARGDLERIIHPAVRRRAREIEAAAPTDAVVVHVIPLLVETGQQGDFDVLVVVDVDERVQLDRLRARTGLGEADARARVAAQVDRQRRLAVADHVLRNTGTVAELEQQVDALWAGLVRHAG